MALRELWPNTSITMRDAAAKLGVDELTVKRRAIYLGLQYPRNTPGSLRANGKLLDRYRIVRKPVREEREKRRQEWLKVLKSNPDASRSGLYAVAPRLIYWLRDNDLEWLEANIPPRRPHSLPVALVDWAKVDVELTAEVKAATLRVRNITNPPVRVSLEVIMNEVGHRSQLENRLRHLPLTSRTLDECLEPFENFLLRKITWAVESFRKEGVKPSRRQFVGRVYARKSSAAINARVQEAVDIALATLV